MSGHPTSDDKTNAAAAAPAAGESGAEPAAPPESQASPQAAAEAASGAADVPSAETMIATLESQVAELTDRLLRAHADMDNMRKRAEKERSDTLKYAVTKFANDVLGLGDNLQRTISAVPAAALEDAPALKSLLDGVTMTEREFLNVLSRHGVAKVDPKGEAFNPHLHQAVMEQQNTEVPAGTVLQVFQPGYTIEDRILRPAMVVVAKGGLKPMKPATESPQATVDAVPDGDRTDPVGNGGGAGGPQPAGGFGRRASPPGDGSGG